MAHTTRNYATKKALKAAVLEGTAYVDENPYFGGYGTYDAAKTKTTIEGPWEYHRFYASATIDPQSGKILKVS